MLKRRQFGKRHNQSEKTPVGRGWFKALHTFDRKKLQHSMMAVYGIAVASVGAGLVNIIIDQQGMHEVEIINSIDNNEIQAILQDMNEERQIDFVELDDLLPIVPDSDAEADYLTKEQEAEASPHLPSRVKKIESLPVLTAPAWQRYAVAVSEQDLPKIAIVIDDMGLVRSATDRLAETAGPLTLAFLPYADDLPSQTQRVRRYGHELMVHLPMEPKSKYADPGRNALLLSVDQAEFDRRLDWNLSRFDGFVGINNHMGSRLTEDHSRMARVMEVLNRSGLLFLDSLTSSQTAGPRAAKASSVPYLKRDVFLDNVREREAITRQLIKTIALAKRRGSAIAIGHPYDQTIDVLNEWLPQLRQHGVQLVPISHLMKQKQKNGAQLDFSEDTVSE